LLPVCYLV